jgi:uncharacterized protein (DUF302 family)
MSAVNETRIEGLTTSASTFGPKETMDRLEAEIRTKGMEVFARVDHAAGAADVGLNLRPTELIIFGNARGGTPHAVSADNRNRSAVEGTHLGGRSRQNVDFI